LQFYLFVGMTKLFRNFGSLLVADVLELFDLSDPFYHEGPARPDVAGTTGTFSSEHDDAWIVSHSSGSTFRRLAAGS
jgi:hypothetical protein